MNKRSIEDTDECKGEEKDTNSSTKKKKINLAEESEDISNGEFQHYDTLNNMFKDLKEGEIPFIIEYHSNKADLLPKFCLTEMIRKEKDFTFYDDELNRLSVKITYEFIEKAKRCFIEYRTPEYLRYLGQDLDSLEDTLCFVIDTNKLPEDINNIGDFILGMFDSGYQTNYNYREAQVFSLDEDYENLEELESKSKRHKYSYNYLLTSDGNFKHFKSYGDAVGSVGDIYVKDLDITKEELIESFIGLKYVITNNEVYYNESLYWDIKNDFPQELEEYEDDHGKQGLKDFMELFEKNKLQNYSSRTNPKRCVILQFKK